MSNEPNKPIPARELTEKELKGVVGGVKPVVPPLVTTFGLTQMPGEGVACD